MQPKPAEVDFSVDLIRVIAIVLVVLVHAAVFPYPMQGQVTLTLAFNWWTTDVYGAVANISVPLFVMLSGALLLNPVKADEPMRVFFKKRFARIGLPMIFWTVAYFLWGYYMHGYPLTPSSILEGVLGGSYYHLWFLYLLVGLYLVTPVLRVLVQHLDRHRFRYLLALWVVGSFLVPFFQVFLDFNFNPVMFVFTGWVGYFLLGYYLLKSKVSSRTLIAGVVLGLLGAIIGDAVAPAIMGTAATGFFRSPLTFNMIIASAAMFLILLAVPATKIQNGNATVNRVIHWISQNTLAIYLFHVMVLETLENGYLGYTLNIFSFSPILEVPALTALTFALTCLILYPLKKIPCVSRVLG